MNDHCHCLIVKIVVYEYEVLFVDDNQKGMFVDMIRKRREKSFVRISNR